MDIWRAAKAAMDLYGDDAAVRAAMRADALLDLGDSDGFHAWKRIVHAINELTRAKSADEPLH